MCSHESSKKFINERMCRFSDQYALQEKLRPKLEGIFEN